MTASRPSPPKGCQAAGRTLWRDITGTYELDIHELALLKEATRTVDQLDELAAAVAADGTMIDGRIHPALVESRQLRIVLARLLAALRLPAGDQDDHQEQQRRPQRRGGVRSPYRIGLGGAPE